MDWVLLVLAAEILLLVFGWVLFQQAKSELNARALEQPALQEMRALAAATTELLEEWRKEANRISAELGAKIGEARRLLSQEALLEETGANAAVEVEIPSTETTDRTAQVRGMALEGASLGDIARETGYSEGEVEFILGITGGVASPQGEEANTPGR